jgi:hypothetical protein
LRRRGEKLKRILIRVLVAVVAAGVLAYSGDYLWLQYRILKAQNPYGTVRVNGYDAVPLKNGKTEFYPLDPVDQTCVHSLFPHFGDPPCWYLERHADRRVDL